MEEQEPDVAGNAGVDEDAPGDMFPALIDCSQVTVPTKMVSFSAGCPNNFRKNRTVEAFPSLMASCMPSVAKKRLLPGCSMTHSAPHSRAMTHKTAVRELSKLPSATNRFDSSPSGLSNERLDCDRHIHTQELHLHAKNASPPWTRRRMHSTASAIPTSVLVFMCAAYSESIAAPTRPTVIAHLEMRARPAHMSTKSKFRMTTSGPRSHPRSTRQGLGTWLKMSSGTFQAKAFQSGSNCNVGVVSQSAKLAVLYLGEHARAHTRTCADKKLKCCGHHAMMIAILKPNPMSKARTYDLRPQRYS